MILAKVKMSPAALSPGIRETSLYPVGIFLGLPPKRSCPEVEETNLLTILRNKRPEGGKETPETPGQRPQEGGPDPGPTFAPLSHSRSQALQGHLHQEVFPWFSILEPSLCAVRSTARRWLVLLVRFHARFKVPCS